MKKTYISPCLEIMVCDMNSSPLCSSPLDGKTLKPGYNPDDISYTNEGNDYHDIWDVK